MSSKSVSEPPTLVMLHGLLGDRHDWDEVSTAMLGVPCLALDLPGHGQNVHVHVTSFDAFERWLNRWLVHHDIQHYCLLGYSLGGRLALYHASQNPPGLRALWLESAHPGLPFSERSSRLAHDDLWAQRFEKETLECVLRDWYQQPVFVDLTETQRARQIQRRIGNSGAAVAKMLRATSLGAQPSQWQWLESATLPIGYFSGQQDAKFQALASRLTAISPRIEHISLEGGHNLHCEQPAKVSEHLHAWYRHMSIN